MKDKLYRLIGTFFYVGYFPKCPGTMGSLAALVIVWFFPETGLHVSSPATSSYILLIVGLFVLGVLAAKNEASVKNIEDPQHIVIDEVVGILITFLFVPLNFTILVAGFFLFRFFDITKILGIKKVEPIPNGVGIMLDDVIAGVYANFVLHGVLYFF